MSWQVNGQGRYYHSWSDYQAALQSYEENSAAVQLRRAAAELSGRIASVRGEVSVAGGDLRRQQELSRILAGQIEDYERTAQRLQAAHEDELTRLDRERDYLRQTLDQTQHNLAEIDTKFAEYRAEFAGKLQEARGEFERGLADLRQQRQELESRILAGKRAVDEQLTRERQQRLDREKDQTKRAAMLLDDADATARRVEDDATRLGHTALQSATQALRANLARARTLDAAPALIRATQIEIEARGAAEQCEQDALQMQADLQRVNDTAGRVQELLAEPRITKLYPRESAILREDLHTILQKAPQVYSRYDAYLATRPAHQRDLSEIQARAEELLADAPIVEQRVEERNRKAEETLNQLIDAMPEVPDVQPERLLDPGDPKSALEFIVNLRGEKVRLTFHLDRGMELSSYEHSDDNACRKSMSRALDFVERMIHVQHEAQDYPSLASAPAQQQPPAPVRNRQELNRRGRSI